MAKRKAAPKRSAPKLRKATVRASSNSKNLNVGIDEASNGFIIRESFEDKRGRFVDRKHIAKTKKEATALAGKILGKA